MSSSVAGVAMTRSTMVVSWVFFIVYETHPHCAGVFHGCFIVNATKFYDRLPKAFSKIPTISACEA